MKVEQPKVEKVISDLCALYWPNPADKEWKEISPRQFRLLMTKAYTLGVKAGTKPAATERHADQSGTAAGPPATGTKQQRLSQACLDCVSQLALAIKLSGQEMDESKAADLMYAYMRDLFHEVSAPGSAEGWVSVEERLPELDTQVLCYGQGLYWVALRRGHFLPEGHKGYVENTWEDGRGRGMLPFEMFTHWRPLPAPPQAGSEATEEKE